MPKPTSPSRFRLSPHVRPTTYRLRLEPDLRAGTFAGQVAIDVDLSRATDTIRLHALELAIADATVAAAGATSRAGVAVRKDDETVTLRLGRKLPAGVATLTLRFAGKLNQHLRGLYAASANGVPYAFSQCEAADCRRIMPCFDEPAFKARFQVSVVVRQGDTALSNAPIEREEPTSGGRVVHFAPTPPLSTYLLALAVGPLEASSVRMLGPTAIRVWHVPGKGHLAGFGLEAAYEALARLEDYFGTPYPYAKLDLVAVPDFEAGAMENAGAVFFRETLLLLDDATVSHQERKRAAEVIAHELAHMWYGDLVTMAWWDDLWLNEAFATWMAYRVVDDWKPEWRMWQSFEHDRSSALALDALANTHPIYAPVRSVAQATENFDVITYEKGAAVVRMLEHYLGADVFRDGVRRYMVRHREGNAVAADLWRALGEASGKDVTRVAQAWIAQPGFPLVTVGQAQGAGRLRLRQERFFADPRVAPARRRARWPVPLVIKRAGGGGEERMLFDRATVEVPSPAPPYFLNAAAGGFYRVSDRAENRTALLRTLDTALTPVERQALVGDQWALVRAGRAEVEEFLEVADALGGETDHDVLGGLAGALQTIADQVVEPASQVEAALRAWVARRFGPAFDRLGWSAEAAEDDRTRLRRAALLRLVGGIAETPEVMAEARRRIGSYLQDRASLEPNLADPVTELAARTGDLDLYDRYREVVTAARTPQERRRFLLTLPSFRARDAIHRTLAALVSGEIPTQDVAFVLMRLFGNPQGREAAWQTLKRRWSVLRKRVPPLMLSRLVEATPALRDATYARDVKAFFARHPVPEAARAVRQALEVFRLNAELRRRTTGGVAGWLADHATR